MEGEAAAQDARKADRIELILEELESLPTLGSVAVRLLDLTADDDADAAEIIRLVASDPALASKVLALCRCHERGRASQVTTVDRAVLLLGFEAVRCAVLSVQVFEVLDGIASPAGERQGRRLAFDREAFWLHSLAVAVASERIAQRGNLARGVRPSEAYMAGLLHDLGQLVLHVLLPESFDQVCRVAETYGASLDHACHRIIGLDSHTAGKRLAEHWGLPGGLIDVIWLNGQPREALPRSQYRDLISVVSLADALVRQRYISAGAHWSHNEDLGTMAIPIGIGADDLDSIAEDLHRLVADQADALGMSGTASQEVLLRSISRANASLGRANAGLRQRERRSHQLGKALDTVNAFLDSVPANASVVETLSRVVVSAQDLLGVRVPATLHDDPESAGWRLVRFHSTGRPFGSRLIDPSPQMRQLAMLLQDLRFTAPAATLAPWLPVHLEESVDADDLRLLPISCGDGRGDAVLVVASPVDEREANEAFETLRRCWRAALASGFRRDGAAHLTEQLAAANRELMDTQEALARSRTLGTLGEVAAGAAHEMNNPLTVISGRSQLLAGRLTDPEQREMASEIVTQSHRLSDMITALRSFAEPVEPTRRIVDLADLVMRVVQEVGPHHQRQVQIDTVFAKAVPAAYVDPDLLGQSLGELVRNAVESKGSRHIELRVQTDPLDGRLKIEVRDDGEGMNDHTLRHAFDPFFSARPAGRQPGLGLARARRFVEAHGGQIALVNGPSGGAIATIRLADWTWGGEEDSGGEARALVDSVVRNRP